MRKPIFVIFIGIAFYTQAQKEGFTKIPSEQSGILFRNDITETDSVNITMYDYLYNGGGVGIIDFNQDGLQDIFLTGNFTDDKLYLNKGNFTFEDVTLKAGITKNGWSTGVCIVDINADGWQDIYVCRSGWYTNSEKLKNVLYINQKNGKFIEDAASYGLDLAGHHTQAAPLDFDHDGDLDLYVMGHPGKFMHKSDFSTYITTILKGEVESDILLENVNGKFIDITKQAGIFEFGYGLGLAITDINHDTYPDIIVCNDFDEPDHVFVNQKNKTFKDENLNYFKHTSNYSMGNDVGDFNNDGYLDYISVDMAFDSHERSKTNMASMTPAKFWARVKLGWGYQYMHNMLHLNTGKGVYQEIAQFSGVAKTDWSWAPLLMDIDMDGWLDLFITNGYKRDTKNNDIQYLINQQLEKKNQISVMELLELIPSVRIENFFFRNTHDLKFADKRADWGIDEKLNSNGAAYADLDNDGDLDLVLNNVDDFASVYQNTTSNGNHYLKLDLSEIPDEKISGAKFLLTTKKTTQAKEANFVRGYQSSVEKNIFFYWDKNDEPKDLVIDLPVYYAMIKNITPDQTIKIRLKDIEVHDLALLDLINFDVNIQDISAQLLPQIIYQDNDYDDFKTETLLPHRMSDAGPQLAVSDLNADGLEDFILSSAVGKIPQVYIQKEEGTFSQVVSPAFYNHQGCEDGGIMVINANKDEYKDIIITSGGYEYAQGDSNYINRLYIGNGQGGFGYVKNAMPKDAFNSGKVIGEDIDLDGDTDLLICGKASPGKYPFPGITSILLNEKGFFYNITDQIAPELKYCGMVNDAEFVDVDGDKDKDIVVVGEWMDITVFIRDKGKFTKAQTGINMPGWWSCITAADIDQDGDQDLLAGNAGLNNKFKASTNRPIDVYANDFDNNGTLDIVLAHTKNEHLLPVRGRECSSSQMPFLVEKFPTYQAFATSDLYQIYSKEKLDSALHYRVTEFRSGIFYNDGKGNFTFSPFGNEAQLSFINDFLVLDINHDGKSDILAIGNRYGSEVETTRYDAGCGLEMVQQPDGSFSITPQTASQFFVPGDAKCMSMIKLGKDGTIGALVANNNGLVQLFSIQ
ncbi:MAG: VCBS repeat-containing protein [Crocinitomicaceae bacterium]|nr:VCBS repeat-containing protein [Crocinitomicaceae bacterium]MBK8926040.1 VCBS repeat-containing protein [Crocinitomicaceae bacterium]